MKTVQTNDTVTLTYTGTLDTGEVFSSTGEDNPITVKIGDSDLPPTVENSLLGMQLGQSCTVRVSPDEGYGARQKNLLQTIKNREVVDKIQPKPGMIITLRVDREGQQVPVPATVMEVGEDFMVVDYNHPLAGHHLTYRLTVLDIAAAVEQ